MNHSRVRKLTWGIMPLLISGVLMAQDNLFKDPVVAESSTVTIHKSDLDNAFVSYRASQASKGQMLPDQARKNIERTLLNRLVFTRLLVNMATDEEKKEAAEKAQKVIEDQKASASSEAAYRQDIASLGLTMEEFEKQVADQAIAEEVLFRELNDQIQVTDEDVRKYYDDHPGDFTYPEQVHVAHVLISTVNDETKKRYQGRELEKRQETAHRVRDLAKAGRDFTMLVKQYSDDLASKENDGEYTFSRGDMVPAFEAAAFSMEPGQVSDIVETPFGYHIIKLIEKIPSHMEDFENVAKDIRKRLELVNLQKLIPDYMDQVMKENKVRILEENLY